MNRARIAAVFAPYLLVSIIHLVALAIDAEQLSTFTKPLLMPLLLAAFLFSLPRIRSEIALLGSLGILFSWAGDVTLASPGDLGFLVGLGFFLLAHVAYIVLFLRKLRMRRLRPIALVYLAWWVALVGVLTPHLGPLLIPVAVYGLVLGAMGALGLSCNRWIAIGGALFVASDTLLGLNKFLPGFELWQVDFLIMLSYIAAQGLIALGAVYWAWGKGRAVSPPVQNTSPSAAQRRTGPLARVNLFRLGITVVLVVTAILAFTLQAGVFRFLFRGALVVGGILLFGSYLWQWWAKRGRAKS